MNDGQLYDLSRDLAARDAQNFDFGVSNQIYYFLRDVSHRHQHHEPNSDTILTLAELAPDRSLWIQRTVFSLYNKCIQMKRDSKHVSHLQSLGVLAYLESFKAIAARRLGRDHIKFDDIIPKFNDEAMRQSIESAKNVIVTELQLREARLATVVALGVGLLGVFVAMLAMVIGFSNKEQISDKVLVAAADYIKGNFSSIVVAGVFFVGFVISVAGKIPGKLLFLFGDFVRLLIGFSAGVHAFIYFFTATLLMVLGWFVWPA